MCHNIMVSNSELSPPILFIGFNAAGKSTLGRLIASEFEWPFYDIDEVLRERGHDADSLLRTDQKAFRSTEASILRDLLDPERVIATGGGIVSARQGRKVLAESGAHCIWLKASFETLVKRVTENGGATKRPLFADLVQAQERFDERQPWYAEVATHTVEVDNTPLTHVKTALQRFVLSTLLAK